MTKTDKSTFSKSCHNENKTKNSDEENGEVLHTKVHFEEKSQQK